MTGAVLTGDIDKWAALTQTHSNEIERVLQKAHKKAISVTRENGGLTGAMNRYLGGGFQFALTPPYLSLRVALITRIWLRSIDNLPAQADAVIGIAIGEVAANLNDSGTAMGDTYQRSGLALDALAKAKEAGLGLSLPKTCVAHQQHIDNELSLLEGLISNLTHAQSNALRLLLLGNNQQQIAKKLEISQAAVNKRLAGAHHRRITTYLMQHEGLVRGLVQVPG